MAPLKNLPKHESPREKLQRNGVESLSEVELLAILIGTGNAVRKQDVINLSREILVRFSSLNDIDRAAFPELADLPGMGEAKSCRLKAAFELGRRLMTTKPNWDLKIASPEIINNVYGPRLSNYRREVFIAVLLDSRQHWLRDIQLAGGSLFECVVNPSDVFSAIVRESPAYVIFVHNHPSGDPTPSEGDRDLTSRLEKAGGLLGIKVLDHIIIGNGKYYSFSNEDELERDASLWRRSKSGEFDAHVPIPDAGVCPDIWCMHDLDDGVLVNPTDDNPDDVKGNDER